MSATSNLRIGDAGWGWRADAWFRSRASPKMSCCRTAPVRRSGSLSMRRDRSHSLPAWTRWTYARKVKEGETTNELFAFLTTEPNKVEGAIHPKAMPAILTTVEEIDTWMNAPTEEALKLQR